MNDGIFIIGFFLFFFVAWVASGGPSKPISFAGPFITPVTTVGTTQSGYGTLPTGSQSVAATRSSLTSIQNTVSGLNKQVQDAKLFGTPSPYRGQVTIRDRKSTLLLRRQRRRLYCTLMRSPWSIPGCPL